MSTQEGCTTISNAIGELLFYTDGISVWNKNQNIMPNGIGLLADFSSSQASVILQNTNSNTIYYIFATTSTKNEKNREIVNHTV